MSQLSKKEKAFCERYFETGDIEEAVRFSGISKNPYELLRRADVTSEIKRLGESVDKNIEATELLLNIILERTDLKVY